MFLLAKFPPWQGSRRNGCFHRLESGFHMQKFARLQSPDNLTSEDSNCASVLIFCYRSLQVTSSFGSYVSGTRKCWALRDLGSLGLVCLLLKWRAWNHDIVLKERKNKWCEVIINKNRKQKRKCKPIMMHVPMLCGWFSSSLSAWDSDDPVFTWS